MTKTDLNAAAILARVTLFCCRQSWFVLLIGLILLAGSLGLARARLGLNSDVDSLFADSLPWKQRQLTLDRGFPQFQDLIVAVIDARIPEQADDTASQLQAALAQDHAHFRLATRPDAAPFLQKNGLMFLDKATLEPLLNQITDAQPFLGQLSSDPSARGLLAAFSLMAMGVSHGQGDLKPFAPALLAFHKTFQAALAGHAQPLSWENLLAGSLADLGGRYRFVLAKPVLDYNAVQPGGAATTRLLAIASALPAVKSGDAHIRITGSVPLSDEEFASAAGGAVEGLVISTLLVMVWLFLAVRSWRLMVPIMLTLALGLGLTTGFAVLAVGTLNLISVAFAVLFVGIAVDFAIQFCVRFRDVRRVHPDLMIALPMTSLRCGGQIMVASVAIAAGFLAFVPTSFLGVAQLGLVAGIGMLIAFVCTITFLPACLLIFRPRGEQQDIGFPGGALADHAVAAMRWPLVLGGILAGVAGVMLLPHLHFDGDPLHTKDPNSPAMRTLAELIQDPRTNPYSIDILRPSPEAADALATRLRALPAVSEVITLDSFVPDDQTAKLALIADTANLLTATLSPPTMPATAVSAPELRLATQSAANQLHAALPSLAADAPLALIAGDLAQLANAPDATLFTMNDAVSRYLPQELSRLRSMLAVKPVTSADLPPDITQDWRLPDGSVRVQVTPKPMTQGAGLYRFVSAVQAIAPDAGGSAVTITATAETIIGAFRNAAIGALIAIAIILGVALRRILDAGLVLATLLLSSSLTVLALIGSGHSLNFANIIALPLLLGVGVSFNIYFVMNWRAGRIVSDRGPLTSPTARAVLASALTTGTAFCSLAVSRHPGTASMGLLLLLSLGCTLLASFLFLPALLAILGPARSAVKSHVK